jgi:hypothetical protein
MQDVVKSAQYSESDVSAKFDGTSDEFMTLAEDVAGSWGWKELAQKLETLDMWKNENGNRRVELMRLAREIGAHPIWRAFSTIHHMPIGRQVSGGPTITTRTRGTAAMDIPGAGQ